MNQKQCTGIATTKKCSPSEPYSPGIEALVNALLDVFVFEVQNRTVVHKREDGSGGFEIRVGGRVHRGDCDSIYGNGGNSCDEKGVKQTQDGSRFTPLRVLTLVQAKRKGSLREKKG